MVVSCLAMEWDLAVTGLGGRGLRQLLFGPNARGIQSHGFLQFLVRLRVPVGFSQSNPEPKMSVGGAGIQFNRLFEILDGGFGSTAHGGRQIVVSRAAAHV